MSRRSRRGARTGVGKASIDMNSLIDLTFLLLVRASGRRRST